MPIDKACLDYVEKLISVFPVEGYGWRKVDTFTPDPNAVPRELRPPPPFRVRIKDFIYEESEIAGAFCIIEEPGHEFNRFWVALFARTDDAILDFTTKTGHYNVMISPDKPFMTLIPGLRPLHPYSSKARCIPRLRGFTEVALSEEYRRRKRGDH